MKWDNHSVEWFTFTIYSPSCCQSTNFKVFLCYEVVGKAEMGLYYSVTKPELQRYGRFKREK